MPILCTCEPNPRASGTPYSPHPFHASAADALVLFSISVECALGHSAFSMLVHRRALLRLCPSPPSNETGIDHAKFAIVPWHVWGPRVARWMTGQASVSVAVAGERAVISGIGIGTPVVMDFHPWRVRASRRQRAKKALRKVVDERPEVILNIAFAEQINSWLPYVKRTLVGFEDYVDLLVDEERLVGLKVGCVLVLLGIVM